jgi:hypothetical protein
VAAVTFDPVASAFRRKDTSAANDLPPEGGSYEFTMDDEFILGDEFISAHTHVRRTGRVWLLVRVSVGDAI